MKIVAALGRVSEDEDPEDVAIPYVASFAAGACRRYPPATLVWPAWKGARPSLARRWPYTQPDDWCGEFERDDEPGDEVRGALSPEGGGR